jgi:hypothetical protein
MAIMFRRAYSYTFEDGSRFVKKALLNSNLIHISHIILVLSVCMGEIAMLCIETFLTLTL